MAYGLPKIPNKEAKQIILDLISAELDKNSEFSGDALAFYGFEVSFTINLTLVSRGESKQEIKGNSAVGELNPLGNEETGVQEVPEKKEIVASGRRRHGKPARANVPNPNI